MFLVVGLGNPGRAYADNRHNIGFMAVDEIVRRHGFSPWRSKFQGEIADGVIDGQKVLALKPMTFMNESGRAVREAATFYKITPEDIIIFHDEIDLAPGKLRVKRGGGHAGHNGLRSVHAGIGADYARVRMGVGHPGDKNLVKTYVLKDFAKADQEWLQPMIDGCAEFLGDLLKGDDPSYMSKVAHRISPNRPNAPKPESEGPDAADNEEKA
ncbi:MAG: aminoacyl-tRNA hydrolase [Rhodospirillales bacterium]|nr:aminoacyl-tRNA hydrolase [Rhodospirillales bacterium]MBO6785433.1 aminoacyl-tRNA hydrolase [Rhodospirillales bacterium]